MAIPAYTFTKKAIPVEPNQQSNFGNVQRDGSKQPMFGYTGNGIQTQDYTGTPVTSPQTVANNSVLTLTTPLNAAAITIAAKTQSVLVSEVSGTTSLASYYEIPAGQSQTFGLANQGTLYLLGGTGSSVVSFFYDII
jgi:hypothetical protein